MSDASQAVIFEPHDYASGPRRLLSLAIDLFVSIILLNIPILIATALWVSPQTRQIVDGDELRRLTAEELGPVRYTGTLIVSLLLPMIYHAGMRFTRFGTIGYFVTRIRLVGPDGRRPDPSRQLKRFALSLTGFVTFGAIYITCFRRARHQAVHDLFAGTWLILRSAKSGRAARLVYNTRLLGTYPLTHADLEAIESDRERTDGRLDNETSVENRSTVTPANS